MRTGLALAVLAFFAMPTPAADEPNFTSEDGKYEVTFLAKMKYRSGVLKEGGIASPFIEGVANENRLKVMYFDLPEAVREVEPKKLFEGGEEGEIKRVKGKLVSSKDGKWGPDKLPYRDFVLTINDQTFRYRILLVDLRIYIIIAGGPKEFGTGKEAAKFIDSFQITK